MQDDIRAADVSSLASIEAFAPDVVLVGSGAAGCALAQRLLDLNFRVLVLEAGGEDVNTEIGDFLDVPKTAAFGMSLQLGGSTNLWSGRTAPLESRDVSHATGWPFERHALDPYYDQAIRLMKLSDLGDLNDIPAYDGNQEQWLRFLAAEGNSLARFQWSRPPFSGLEHFRRLGKEYANLKVLLNCRVTRLVVDSIESQKVSGVELFVGGALRFLKAKIVVVCAGGIETPRLLLNSAISGGHAIFKNDSIGRYLSTHPKSNVAKVHLFKPVKTAAPLFSDFKVGAHEFRFGIGSSAGELNHYVQFSGRFESIGLGMLHHAQMAAAGGAGRFSGQLSVLGRSAYNLIGKLGLLGKAATVLTVRGFFDQFPNSDNRVRLSESSDPYGYRKAEIEWQFSEKDRQSVHRFLADLARSLEVNGVGRMQITLPPPERSWPGLTGIHSHFLGTTRMGRFPQSSVVDEDGRYHGVRNLFVAGASAFSTYGYANPVLTIMALAFKTADAINRDRMVLVN